MPRREFFRSTLGWAGAALLAPACGFAAAEPPRRIKAGFLGVAHSHAAEKLRLVRESTDFELIGICEADAAVRAPHEKAGVPTWSQAELLARCELVIVESAVRDHARHAKAALAAGRHVHVEKPPADTLAAFREMQALARERRCVLQVGYMWRFNPGFMAALEAARKGWLGEVYLVRGTMNSLIPGNRRPEWAEFKGGATFELGCHLIDPLVRLLGRPTAVTPHLRTHGGFADQLADNCVVTFEFPKALGLVTNTTLQPGAGPHRHFEILGTNGTAMLKPLEPPALHLDLAQAAGPYRSGSQNVALPPYRRYVDELAALARAIRGEVPLAVTPDEELAVQETVLRASGML